MDKIKEIDYLRGIATILVILIHLTSSAITFPVTSLSYQLVGAFNCAITFVVPTFLFISALIMTYKLKNTEKICWSKFLLKRIIKVLSALIIWSLIYILYWGDIFNLTQKKVLGYLILGNASYHLYFIPLIIQLYLLFPIIWIIVKNISKIKINLLLSFFICIVLCGFLQYSFTTIFRLNIFKTFIHFPTIIFSYTLPISIGIWIGFNYSQIKKFYNKFFIVFLLIFTIFACYYYVKINFVQYTYKATLLFSPLYWSLIILTLTYFLRYINKSTFLSKISQKSFVIYLSHPLILDILNKSLNYEIFNITPFLTANYFINIFTKFLITLSMSYFLSYIWFKLRKEEN